MIPACVCQLKEFLSLQLLVLVVLLMYPQGQQIRYVEFNETYILNNSLYLAKKICFDIPQTFSVLKSEHFSKGIA